MSARPPTLTRLRRWLLEEGAPPRSSAPPDAEVGEELPTPTVKRTRPWWQVLGLMGVDYFSTLGYQPGIALLAAGALSPVATLVLVLVTLLGALPTYRRVAKESPRGEGSINMLERLLPFWTGKLTVLALLGFLVTDLVLTITLSAADASVHLAENPLLSPLLSGTNLPLTLLWLLALGAAFLLGFREVVGIAMVLVAAYLTLGGAVIARGLAEIVARPELLANWKAGLFAAHGNPLLMLGAAALLFPRLALGLSGFETGVAVMPRVRGEKGEREARLRGRVENTQKMLTVAALVMSVYLLLSSLVTTLLIEPQAYAAGGAADERALSYLAHAYLGRTFGSLYDLSTVLILWFAGVTALTRLLNFVPRFLPRYGMAPDWARRGRPLVLLFTLIGVVVTLVFGASVDAQAGAYATGVLVVITSAAFAVTLSARRRGERAFAVLSGLITAVFAFTSVANIVERPEGIRLASVFIVAIVALSIVSRAARSVELRADRVELDRLAERFLVEAGKQPVRLIAHHPSDEGRRDRADKRKTVSERFAGQPEEGNDAGEYRTKLLEAHVAQHLPPGERPLFVEVHVTDASGFADVLEVRGTERAGQRVLQVYGASVPNAIAALLLAVRDATGVVPHVYFGWNERGPFQNAARFLLGGEGDIALVTHEVLRLAEKNRARRPVVHLGG